MILFRKDDDKLILRYKSDQPSPVWVYRVLEESDSVAIGKAFTLTKNQLISILDDEDEHSPVEFEIAKKENDYYHFYCDILSLSHDLFIHESVNFEHKFFVAERGISIFRKIDELVDESIYIGGDNENAIPLDIYNSLLKAFPNSYELKRYASARISSILSSYIDTKEDYEEKYQTYLNKKPTIEGSDLSYLFSEMELIKYNNILKKINNMLNAEESYSESQWQEELLQIILFLYPKYIHVFKEAPVRDIYNSKDRRIDYLLVDSCGNTDIIEIKKPFDKCIVTQRTYRDNFIPLKELSGTVMQIEKYLFYLNKWGRKGEDKLTEHYKNELPENFQIKIINPGGIIIMGRKLGLSEQQLQDLEIIKRKYKNVIDIITYDDLIERLEFMIRQWTGMYEQSKPSN